MAFKNVPTREAVIDIKAGVSNEEIGKKYGLSPKGVQSLFDQLLALNLLTEQEHAARSESSSANTSLSENLGGTGTDLDPGLLQGAEPTGPREFIDVCKLGKNGFLRYVVGILFILFFPSIVGGITGVVLGIHAKFDEKTATFVGMSPLNSYLFLHVRFVLMFIAVLLVVRYEHNRPILSLITPQQSINWKKIGKSFGIFWVLLFCVLIVDYLMDPSNFRFTSDFDLFLSFVPAVLVLTPIQTTAEELFFRGYLLQMTALLTRNRAILIIFSGVLFLLPHLANPEVSLGFVPMALQYFGAGAFFTLVTLKSNSLEPVIGIHAATNVFLALIANYDGSALKTASLIVYSSLDPVGSLISFCIISTIFYLVMFGRRSQKAELPEPQGDVS